MGRAFGVSSKPHWIRSNILDFQGAISVKIGVENGKFCSTTTMGKRL